MLHELVMAGQTNPDAAGFILHGIKGIFVAIGSILAAIAHSVVRLRQSANALLR